MENTKTHRHWICLTALGVLTFFGCGGSSPSAQSATKPPVAAASSRGAGSLRIENVGLQTPESVVYWEEQDVYLVSNINGGPLDRDDNGFISRISPNGSVESLRWIDGASEAVELNAPKGMGISAGKLYVTDMDRVRVFELSSGAETPAIEVAGATFLNDIAVSSNGDVFVSDTGLKLGEQGLAPSGTDAIYRIAPEGALSTVVAESALGLPNGLSATPTGVTVVTWSGKIYSVGLDGVRSEEVSAPAAQLDGVEELPDGRLVMSSWEGKGLYVGAPTGPFEFLLEDLNAPADIGYDTKRGALLIPLFEDNAIVVHPLQP